MYNNFCPPPPPPPFFFLFVCQFVFSSGPFTSVFSPQTFSQFESSLTRCARNVRSVISVRPFCLPLCFYHFTLIKAHVNIASSGTNLICAFFLISLARVSSWRRATLIELLLVPNRLVGLVVKASTPRAADLGFDSRLRRGTFSGSSRTSDLDIGTPVATLPGAWRYRASAWTGWSGVNIL